MAALALTVLAGCSTDRPRTGVDTTYRVAQDQLPEADASTRVDLMGAGATFPYPLYLRWFNEYARLRNVRINYQSIGSAGGVRQLLAGDVDFGASDTPVPDSLWRGRPRVLHVPMAVGAVALTYNLPRLARPLRLSGDVIADLFGGRITTWNDPRLVAINPGVDLPDLPVRVAYRGDGSGTSGIFRAYLASIPGRPAPAASELPTGLQVEGNEGIASYVKTTEGAIGYLEVVYARQNRLPAAHVRNLAGRFVSPMPYEIASAAAQVFDSLPTTGPASLDIPARLSLVQARGAQTYPIAAFTWLLLRPEALETGRLARLVDFVHWALTEGSPLASSLGYVPLPSAAAERVLDQLDLAVACPSCGTRAATPTVR